MADWYIDFPASLWERWPALLELADAVFELGRREDVFRVDPVPPASARDQSLFGHAIPKTRVSVFGPSEIEDRVVEDLRPTLLSLRPDLDPVSVPHASALDLKGPLSVDRSNPVYVSISISIYTDLWFPRVVGIQDDPGDGPLRWYDNRPLADRHTPRLNRFLVGVRDAAAKLGGTWSYEAEGNRNYTTMVHEGGIDLESPLLNRD